MHIKLRLNQLEKQRILLLLTVCAAGVLVGTLAVLYTHVFMQGVMVARMRYQHYPHMLFIVIPMFFLVSAYLCRRFAPRAAGSGPENVLLGIQALEAGDSAKASGYLGIKTFFVIIASSFLMIFGGGALGREGPLVQMSASIFLILAEKTKRFLPALDFRAWVIAGSAAGFAAAFNAPLAGIVFAMEELSLLHFDARFSIFKMKTLFAVIVAAVISQFFTGSYVLFEFPRLDFAFGANFAVILIMALSCGALAWILKKSIRAMAHMRNRASSRTWFLFPVIGGLVVAAISVNIGVHSFGAGELSIKEALHSASPMLSWMDVGGRFVAIIATMAAGCAGGLLLPALALGAGIGSVASHLLPMEDARVFIATGMAAFLGALWNIPLTAAILVFEITDQRELILQLFLATLVGSWIFQKLEGYTSKTAS